MAEILPIRRKTLYNQSINHIKLFQIYFTFDRIVPDLFSELLPFHDNCYNEMSASLILWYDDKTW